MTLNEKTMFRNTGKIFPGQMGQSRTLKIQDNLLMIFPVTFKLDILA